MTVNMDDTEDISKINENELIKYYGYGKVFGKLQFRLKFAKSWILHSLAYFSPHPGFTIKMQRARGVRIGKGCYIGPYVQIDLLYPEIVTIEDNVAIGSNSMIFAHTNPAANLYLKKKILSKKTWSRINKIRSMDYTGMYYYIRYYNRKKCNFINWKCCSKFNSR